MLLMDLESFKCPQCEFTHTNLNSLRIHWQKAHKQSSEELRIALFGRPTCECGCGELTPFNTLQLGFVRFINGHNSRVSNGWTSQKSKENSLKTRRDMWKRGEIKGWAHGKPADHPQNVKRRQNMQLTILNDPEERKRRSERLSKNRLSRVVPNLYGKEHPNWKGGTSALQPLVRSYVFNVWTRPKLVAANFTCQRCAATKNLEVHHDQERFADILQKAIAALGEPGDDFSRKAGIAVWVAGYHITNNVSGIVLCGECHEREHMNSDTYRDEADPATAQDDHHRGSLGEHGSHQGS